MLIAEMVTSWPEVASQGLVTLLILGCLYILSK